MADNYVLRSEWDGVLELVFNRPEKLNALTQSMFGAVRQAVDDLRNRPDLKVLLIRSTGRYFSAGVDLTQSGGADMGGSPMEARRWIRTEQGGMHALYEEMEKVEKPIVVAHHATCVGGGLEMSLSCDFRLAAKSAAYWFPEMQIGMLPLSGGISKLTRIVGAHWARWMVIANEKVSADQALNMGLVHTVYPDETFEQDVKAFCLKLASFPMEVVSAGKLAVELAQDLPSDQARQLERLSFSALTFAPGRDAMAGKIVEKLKGNK
jgi:enoyl-CoA hydratase/carnithine racemase